MRATRRVLTLAVVALCALPWLAGAAAAAEGQAWQATGPLAPADPDPGQIYVSQVAGQEQARAFVEVPSGTASVQLVEGSNVTPAGAALVACPTTGPVHGSGKVDVAPDADCTTSVALARAPDGTWTLDAASLAGHWVAIVPGPAAGAAFSIGFTAAKTSFTPAAVESPTPGQGGPDLGGGTPYESLAAPAMTPSLSNPDVVVPPVVARAPDVPRPAAAPATVPALPSRHPSRDRLPAAPVLLAVGAMAAAALLGRAWLPSPLLGDRAVPRGPIVSVGVAALLVAWIETWSETAVYKIGFVGIVFIAAIGLHILVNWTGELSLAHAAFIGLPAFLVAQLADHTGWSPIVFLPIGVVIGAVLGMVVAVPAGRARGLQVALVTLAIAIAITQFLFTKTWVIGPRTGLDIPEPSLLGIHFHTSRSLLPVLIVVLVLAVLAARAILASSVGRALSHVRLVPDAAATAGVPVAYYRGAAYAMAGAFAGLAGATYVLWVQRVGPQAFPLNLGFNYLVIATLAGRGGLLGLAISVVGLEGGRLFSIIPDSIGLYLGPIALIYNVTRYQAGINGAIRDTVARFRNREEQPMKVALRVPVVIAGVLIAVGFGAIALAWYHAGNTDQLWIQNQELLSGGIGGGALVIVGAALLLRDALLHGAATVRRDVIPDE